MTHVSHDAIFNEAQRIVEDALSAMPADVSMYLGRARGVLHMAGMLLPEQYDQRLTALIEQLDERVKELRG